MLEQLSRSKMRAGARTFEAHLRTVGVTAEHRPAALQAVREYSTCGHQLRPERKLRQGLSILLRTLRG